MTEQNTSPEINMPLDEEKLLLELGKDLANAERSPWEPRCVCNAFRRRPSGLVLTMQGWIDLEAAQSPLLEGKLPDGEDVVEQLSAAVDAFGIGPIDVTPLEAIELGNAMLKEISTAFSMNIRMIPPGESHPNKRGGFGTWLPLLSCLIGQLGMSRTEALSTPVGQALSLIAAHRFNQGVEPQDATYAQREVLVKGEA